MNGLHFRTGSKLIMVAWLGMATQVLACSPLTEMPLRRVSDAVVWGTYTESGTGGEGTLLVSRQEKGAKQSIYHIRWDPNAVSDGVSCPDWQPLWKRQRGRFYLSNLGDGTFSVLGVYEEKRVKH